MGIFGNVRHEIKNFPVRIPAKTDTRPSIIDGHFPLELHPSPGLSFLFAEKNTRVFFVSFRAASFQFFIVFF